MNNKKTFLILALVLVALLGGAGVLYNVLGNQAGSWQLAVQSKPEQPQKGQAPGSEAQEEGEEQPPQAPDFTVYDGEGNPVMLSEFAGRPVVLNFWASWCGPCKSEMPHFETAYAEYGEEISFLMVNCTGGRETLESAKEYIEESGYTFPVYYDTDGLAAYLYGAYSIPLTYFIDAGGYVAARGSGALDLETLERGIGMVLPQ